MITRLLVFSVLALLTLQVSQSHAQSLVTRSGPNSAFSSRFGLVNTNEGGLGSATIQNGDSNAILVITATINDNQAGGASDFFAIKALVNEDELIQDRNPPGYAYLQVRGSGTPHTNTTSVTWWVDLDTAGLANQPLTIKLRGYAFPFASTAYVSFTAYTVAK